MSIVHTKHSRTDEARGQKRKTGRAQVDNNEIAGEARTDHGRKKRRKGSGKGSADKKHKEEVKTSSDDHMIKPVMNFEYRDKYLAEWNDIFEPENLQLLLKIEGTRGPARRLMKLHKDIKECNNLDHFCGLILDVKLAREAIAKERSVNEQVPSFWEMDSKTH